MPEETTRSPRVLFQRPVRVRSLDGKGPSRRLWALNLSEGGIFIRTADPPPLGARLRIEVEWASTVIPLAEGEVVWSRPCTAANPAGFGVRFVRVEGPSRSMLDALLKHGGSQAGLWVARESAQAAR